MMIVVTYDVSTADEAGKRRLRNVAKQCQDYGQRVQHSVFECVVDPLQYEQLKAKLAKLIDQERDSLRFYRLGSSWKNRVEHIGAKVPYDPEDLLLVE